MDNTKAVPPSGELNLASPAKTRPASQAVQRTPDGRYLLLRDSPVADVFGDAPAGAEVVITPGGVRLKSMVHEIERGAIIDGSGGHYQVRRRSGERLADLGVVRPKPAGQPLMPANTVVPKLAAPALGSGWIADLSWNRPSTPISSFSTTWTVPPAPSTDSGQLIYLFNGLQSSTMIYQPVLQWGNNGSFGGSYWCVATWYADGQGGVANHSVPVTVNSGDVLVGVMNLTGQSTLGFSYSGLFQGIANSEYDLTNVPEMWQAVLTLECYGMTQCSDYPNTANTFMTSVNIQTGSDAADVAWTVQNLVTDCGQHAEIFDNDSTGQGSAYLWYQNAPYWLAGAGTVAPGADWSSWFTFNPSDAGPQLVQAQPNNASGYLWTNQLGESSDGNGNLTYYATVNNTGSNAVAFQWRGGGR